MNFNFFYLIKAASLFLLVALFFSCASKKDIVYYQNIDQINTKQNQNSYEIKIQPDDLLMITVSAEDPETAIAFNAAPQASSTGSATNSAQSYLVDAAGTIEFPVLGKLKVGGMSRSEVLKLLDDKIAKYIKSPIINLRILNFKISMQGEVNAPATYPIASDRVTLIEAISMAGDLTIYGKRDNILIIREVDGVKSFNRVDVTKADFINSPFYYLAQNDVVYVEPNKVKINGAAVGPGTGIIVSLVSVGISLITLAVTLTN